MQQKGMHDYQEVISRGDVVVLPLPLKATFIGKFFRFENEKVLADTVFSTEKIHWCYEPKVDLTFTHEFSRDLSHDGFELSIDKAGHIRVVTHNMRGLRYAKEALENLVKLEDNRLLLPVISIRHTPSFQVRGIIEGFYGRPWTRAERVDCLRFIGQHRMNTYMYAPKDDDYQRKNWRDLYPEDWTSYFKELLGVAKEEGVDFWYMISPGLDFGYTNPEDYRLLKEKLSQLLELGISHFGLLLDDIDYSLVEEVELRFQTTAHAQAHLVTEIYRDLQEKFPAVDLVVCPTEYDNCHDSIYLQDLSANIPEEIAFFWTGPSTLAGQISEADAKVMSQSYNRPMIIWDNVPVNDFEKDPERLLLSPYQNRSPFLAKEEYQIQGVLSNPMIYWELSKLTVLDMSHYLWDCARYQVDKSWEQTLLEYTKDTDLAEDLAYFAWHNSNRHLERELPFEIEDALNRNDLAMLDKQMTALKEAVERLKTLQNQAFQEQVVPWFERVEKDAALFEAIKAEEETAALYDELQTYPYRIGSNIAVRYLTQKEE